MNYSDFVLSKQQIENDLIELKSFKKICEKYNRPTHIIRYWINKYDIDPSIHFKIQIPQKEILVNKFSELNNNLVNTAKYFGVKSGKIRSWFEQYNIEINKRKTPVKIASKKIIESSGISIKDMTKNDWQNLIDEFGTKSKIAENLNISISSVTTWCDRHNITLVDGRDIAPNKIKMPSKEELENLYQNSMSYCDIAKHYGNVSNVTVKKWFIKHNIKTRTYAISMARKSTITNIEKYGTTYPLVPKQSKGELEIINWLNDDLGFNFGSTRNILSGGYELDGYDSNINVAIKYCGLYWHSELVKKDKNYHLNKLIQCRQQGIRLFTVYENEWDNKKQKVKDFLSSQLGKYSSVIYARDCNVEIITDNRAYYFFEEYHLQGRPQKYEFCVVLKHNGEIISGMSFGPHHRYNDNNILVLNRLCFKPGYKIIGGSQRMFSYAPKNKKIVSWSDNRWSEGNIYKNIGFTKEIEYPPSYDYITKNGKLFSKQSMTKKILGAAIDQSEHEKANELGFYKIWDCGKIKWTYT